MEAAPTIWTIVAITSEVMKMARIRRGGRGEKGRPIRRMRCDRMVYIAAERKTWLEINVESAQNGWRRAVGGMSLDI